MSFKIPDTPEELLRQSKMNLNFFNKWIPYIVILGVLLSVGLSSFYSIGTDEVGVIQRFGKYARTTSPGLHWKLPMGIEKLSKVKVRKVYKEEFGFRTIEGGVKSRYSSQSYADESLMLTGDLNVLDVRWSVQFKINDPKKILFNVRDPRETVRDMSEVIMRRVVGDRTVTQVLTTEREEINKRVEELLQEALDEYNAGITITDIELRSVNPPDEVKKSFNEENEAEQEREKMINQAWKDYNAVIPKARGEAEKIIQEAEGYALRRVNEARGDASKFKATWEAYKSSKDVTRRRLYLETILEVLPQVEKKFIMEPSGSNVLPLLNLTGETQ